MVSNKTGNADILTFDEEPLLCNIESIHKKIKNRIVKAKYTTIQWNDPVQIDLAGLQLLKSVRTSAHDAGSILELKISLTEESMNLLINTGFGDIFKAIIQQ